MFGVIAPTSPGLGIQPGRFEFKAVNRSATTLLIGQVVTLAIGAGSGNIPIAGEADTYRAGGDTSYFGTVHLPNSTGQMNMVAPQAIYIGSTTLADNQIGTFLLWGITDALIHSTAGTGDILEGLPVWHNLGGDTTALEVDVPAVGNQARYTGMIVEDGTANVATAALGKIWFNGFGWGWMNNAVS